MAQQPSIVAPHQASRETAGDKGMQLVRLARLGEPVPKWFAVSPQALQETLVHSGLAGSVAANVDKIRSDPDTAIVVAETIQRTIRSAKMTFALKYKISEAMKECLANEGTYSVRAAPVDSPVRDVHESFLYQRDSEDVCHAILGVWASTFSEAAITQRLEQGEDPARADSAVIVQDMVDARTSGIMTTISLDPRDLSRIHIRSLWGCGEGLADGTLPADTFRISKRGGEETTGIAVKSQELVRNTEKGSGIMRSAIPDTQQTMRSLSQQEVTAIAEQGTRIEAAYGHPQEVEFAVDTKGQIYILGTRPLEAVLEDGPAAGNEIRWGRSAMMEGYDHVIPPLCFSVLRRIHHFSHLHFTRAIGVPWNTLVDKQGVFPKLLGRILGRVVQNLDQWEELMDILPGRGKYGDAIDRHTGLRSTGWVSGERPRNPFSSLLDVPRRSKASLQVRYALARLRQDVPRFLLAVERALADWRGRDLEVLRPHELMALYDDIERFMVNEWKTPLVNDLATIIRYEQLRSRCIEQCRDPNGSLQNDLLCGIGGFDGTESSQLLSELAQTADLNPTLKAELLERSPADLAERLPALREDEAFKEQYQELLSVYGDDSPAGMRLEAITLRDDPTPIFRILQMYLQGTVPPHFSAIRQRNEHYRVAAERVVRDSLGPIQRLSFKRLLTRTRNATRNRDKLLKAQSRVHAMVRDVLLCLGQRFATENILREPRDIFFLTLPELRDFIQGAADTTDLQGLADLRRAEHLALQDAEAPDGRFTTFGVVYHRNQFRGPEVDDSKPAKILYGTGCCPGTAEGEAVIITDPASQHATIRDAILVSGQADPSWTPLFPTARALLLEQGSPLSHSVILARELGLPTITGIPNLLQRVSEGQTLRINGTDGTVEFVVA